jgi:hypothetical protein
MMHRPLLAASLCALAGSFASARPQSASPSPEIPALVHGGEPHAPLRTVYEGTLALEAHLSKPHATMQFGSRMTVLADAQDRARLDWATWRTGHEEDVDTESTLIDGAHVWWREHATSPYVEAKGKHAVLLRARVEAFVPWRMLARMRAAPASVSDRKDDAWTWSDAGSARRFTLDPSTHRLASITRAFAHPRLGDARDEITYASWSEHDGVALPDVLSLRELDGENVLRASPTQIDVHLTHVDLGVDVGHELDDPTTTGAAESGAESSLLPEPIDVEVLDPGVVSFASKSLDARTIIVEFGDHLVAIDAPLSSVVGEHILAAVHARFPTKPVRYVLFGHYHPHYTGGLRAFMADGAKVVAPEGCAKFAAEIADRPFTLEPDAWTRKAQKPQIETFHGVHVLEDATRRLEVFDIGAKSQHTDEYLVFYLPKTRTLLQDDIGWSAGKDGKLFFGARSRGLAEALAERKLDVATLWQSWPVQSSRPSITYEELQKGVQAAK